MFIVLVLVGLLCIPFSAHALLPPDVIFNVGSSVVQFFSIAALVAGGIFSSVVYTGRRWLALSGARVWWAMGFVLVIVCSAISIVYVLEMQKERNGYQAEIARLEMLVRKLEAELGSHVSWAEYQALAKQLSEKVTEFDPTTFVYSSSSVAREFYSDSITLYGEIDSVPFALEIDFNRVEQSAGVFLHYTYMSGNLHGTSFADNVVMYSTSTDMMPNRFVRAIEHQWADDLSPRGEYELGLVVNGEPLTIVIDGLQGDFITRDRPSYLQHQSVGKATLQYHDGKYESKALVEVAYSNDSTKHIFFEGRDQLDSTTHQFVLWDEFANFYLVDISDVRSATPNYSSHTWVLYKDAETELMQKSFEAEVEKNVDNTGGVSWEVVIPGLKGTSMTLAPQLPFKQVGDDRFRSMVVGKIRDVDGERAIGGVLHLIE